MQHYLMNSSIREAVNWGCVVSKKYQVEGLTLEIPALENAVRQGREKNIFRKELDRLSEEQ